jgi:hypothetical protein
LSASEAPDPGRHHVGTPGDIISECPGDFVGIRTLERATDGSEHYEVLDEARNVVGHIMLSDAAPPEMPWIWTVASGPHTGRKSTHGYEATREAAMEAFARVWHRE